MENEIIDAGSYKVIIGSSVLGELDNLAAQTNADQVFILADETTGSLCIPPVLEMNPGLRTAKIIEIPAGEQHKNIETALHVFRALSRMGASRSSLLVNIGGGVVTDLGGFVASVFKRGIRFINVPTTLLAQVDASVGGKTGVDLDHLKNEIGTFSDPFAVLIWSGFLKTLSRRQMLSGFAESVKHALICNRNYWEEIKNVNPADDASWTKIIGPSLKIKNGIVRKDPHEENERKKLNFGHTVGHAVESYFLEGMQKSLLHGEAIVVGMICETWLSVSLAGLPDNEAMDICRFLVRNFRPERIEEIEEHRIIELMRHDKKNVNNRIVFSLLEDIGSCRIGVSAEPGMIRESFKFFREQLSMWKE